jgi:hypothetical protein
MSTPYTSVFAGLNPQLNPGKPPIHTVRSYTWIRNPPRILCHEQEVKDRVCRTFETTPLLFEQHAVSFPFQERDQASPIGIPVLDVNYLWSSEYYHFMTEVLPNVLFLNEPHPIYCQISKFTVPMFRWFGVQNQVVASIPHFPCRIRAKFVECGNPSPEKIRALRKVVGSKIVPARKHGILIHRQKSRALLNEPEVLATLKTVYPELEWKVFDLPSVEETIELFSNAAIIVGPHGAGMTNMLFSAYGIPIVEFMPLEQPNMCYWHLSEMLGNRYFMIPVKSEGDYCMRVDCSALPDLLRTSIGNLYEG